MTYKEISEFLSSFNTNSYNRSQIGNKKQVIISTYEFLKKLNMPNQDIETLIRNIAYLNAEEINLPLYLELLSKSYSFSMTYELKEVIKVVRQVHDLYYKNAAHISLEEYVHDTQEARVRKLFLNRNNKYIIKNFTSPETLTYISNLKLAAAMELNQKDYNEFMNYIDNYEKYQDTYSPLIIFKTYNRVRKHLKENTKLFWDIFFGNEYVVALNKHSMKTDEIYKKNIYSNYKQPKQRKEKEPLQLDLFTYQEVTEEPEIREMADIKCFQFCTIYNSNDLPDFHQEKDLLMYYKNLLDTKEKIELPRLKGKNVNYIYNVNI